MGIFDAVKSRLGRGNQNDYAEDDQYYNEEEYYDPDYQEYEEQGEESGYYDDGADAAASNRNPSVFNDYTPLVSMSDVRSQELPPLSERPSSRGRQQAQQIKTSLPYVGDPAMELEARQHESNNDRIDYDRTGQLKSVAHSGTRAYAADDSADPLLKRHSLSNTGDFSATSPAYYASRSGVGHVRPAGQTRRTHKFREAIVIRPESYAEAEQVATNLRRGNAVVLVLTQTRPELAKRILDFSFGAAAVAEGQVISIGERIYALTSDHALTETEMELLRARGIL